MLEALNYVIGMTQPLVPENKKNIPSEPGIWATNYVAAMLDDHYFP